MTDPNLEGRAPDALPSFAESPEDTTVGITPEFVEAVVQAIEAGDEHRVRELAAPLHFSDAADLAEQLTPDQRRLFLEAAKDILDPEFFTELDETLHDDVMDIIGLDAVAEVVSELDTDDAVFLMEDMEHHEQRQVLDALSPADRTLIEEGLSYPEYSAGRLMQREIMTVPEFWTVGETIDFLRTSAEQDEWALPEVFYDIVVVDPKHAPVGTIPLSLLLRSKRPTPVTDIMHEEMRLIPVEMDQEEVAFLFRQRNLVSAPVINGSGRLVGMITVDDVVDVIDEEAEDDILRLGGLSEDDLYSATLDTTKSRFTWLFVNLFTAFLSANVIALFQSTIEQVVALAVLMPIVAGMGGNAGTQALTVAVRALATKELGATNALRQIGKEGLVGLINGVLFACLMGTVAWLWFSSPVIGLVIGFALVANLLVAGLAGASIPIALQRLGVDPAVASGIFLTAITDVVGFLVFLGLGTLLLL